MFIVYLFRLGYAVYILQQLMEKHPDLTEEHKKTIVMYDIACTLHKHLQVHLLFKVFMISYLRMSSNFCNRNTFPIFFKKRLND